MLKRIGVISFSIYCLFDQFQIYSNNYGPILISVQFQFQLKLILLIKDRACFYAGRLDMRVRPIGLLICKCNTLSLLHKHPSLPSPPHAFPFLFLLELTDAPSVQ